MINKYTATDKQFMFNVVDIETDERGRFTDGCVFNGYDYWFFKDSQKLAEFIALNAGVYYAHAGMRFDFVLLFSELIQYSDWDVNFAGSTAVMMKSKTVTLLDSYRLIPVSLAAASGRFSDVKKVDLGGKMPWELPEDERIEYLRVDCLSLWNVIDNFYKLISTHFTRAFAPTLPSLALKLWRATLKKPIMVTMNDKVLEFEKSSYFGGLCWVNDKYVGDVYDVVTIDVNSMYPYQMLGLFPASYRGGWSKKFNKRSVGLWRVKYVTDGLPFIFDVNTRSLTHEGVGIVDTETVNFLMENYWVDVEIGYIYSDTDYIFKDFIEHAYKLRLTGDDALSFTAKILMNSLYGKFAQKPEGRRITTKYPGVGEKFKVSSVGGSEVFEVFESSSISHRFVVLSSLVTLRARLHLKKLSVSLGCEISYCDTDSLHLIAPPNLTPDKDLGGYKKEFDGRIVYLGKKLYQMLDENNQPVVTKCKGVPKAVIKNVSFVDFICEVFTFNPFPSILEVVHKDTEFGVKYATRTIKKTVKDSPKFSRENE